jgi:hypothetical protein
MIVALRRAQPGAARQAIRQPQHCGLTINDKFSEFDALNGDGLRGKSLQGLNQPRIAASQTMQF